MACSSINWVRRRLFERFYYSHVAFTFGAFIMSCLHVSRFWYYLVIPATLYTVDKFWRIVSCFIPVAVVKASFHSYSARDGLVTLTLRPQSSFFMRSFTYSAGAYYFLNVPALSWLQWHPFSLACPERELSLNILKASPPDSPQGVPETLSDLQLPAQQIQSESSVNSLSSYSKAKTCDFLDYPSDHITFHIKTLGGWTSDLARLVESGKLFSVRCEGPYGSLQIQPRRYSTLVLCAGGIGITPMLSIFDSSVKLLQSSYAGLLQRVHLVWVVKSQVELSPIALELMEMQTKCPESTQLSFHVSSNDSSVGQADIPFSVGRPVWAALLSEKSNPQPVGVMVCGPHAMCVEVQRCAAELGHHVHQETFEL